MKQGRNLGKSISSSLSRDGAVVAHGYMTRLATQLKDARDLLSSQHKLAVAASDISAPTRAAAAAAEHKDHLTIITTRSSTSETPSDSTTLSWYKRMRSETASDASADTDESNASAGTDESNAAGMAKRAKYEWLDLEEEDETKEEEEALAPIASESNFEYIRIILATLNMTKLPWGTTTMTLDIGSHGTVSFDLLDLESQDVSIEQSCGGAGEASTIGSTEKVYSWEDFLL